MLITIFGKRGTGKTTLIRGNLDQMPGPVVVIDVLGNFKNYGYIESEKISETVALVQDYKKTPRDSDGKLKEKIFVLQTQDPDQAVEYIGAALWECGGGTLVLDEVDMIAYSKGSVLDQLVRYGRNRNVSIVTGCRRPAELHRNFTAGANKIYVYQTQEPRDIEYFEKTILGTKARKLGNLPEYHGILIDYDRKETCEFNVDENGFLYILNTEPFFQPTS